MSILRNSRGIAIIYVTLFLLVLGILFFALGVDIGWMVYVKTQGQAATDASALAAAAAIPNVNTSGNQDKANEMAALFNSDNTVMNQTAGITSSNVVVCEGNSSSPTCPATDLTKAAGVMVTRTYNTPLFFTRLLNGAASTDISVSSTAWLGGAGGMPPEVPIAICENKVYQIDANGNPQCVSPFTATFSPNGTDTAAWWNKADVGQPSASECKGMVAGTKPVPFLAVGEIIDLNNGGLTSCLKEIQDHFATCSPASCDGSEGQAKLDYCTVIMPVVHCEGSINNNEPVKEFAAVCITAVVDSGDDKLVQGTVKCNVTGPGSIGGGPALGVYAERPILVK